MGYTNWSDEFSFARSVQQQWHVSTGSDENNWENIYMKFQHRPMMISLFKLLSQTSNNNSIPTIFIIKSSPLWPKLVQRLWFRWHIWIFIYLLYMLTSLLNAGFFIHHPTSARCSSPPSLFACPQMKYKASRPTHSELITQHNPVKWPRNALSMFSSEYTKKNICVESPSFTS